MRNLLLGVLLGACLLLLENATARPAELGTGLICDTQKQIEDVVALASESRNFPASLEKVNNGANVCGVAPVVYIRHETVATIRTPDGRRDIVRITVVGLVMPYGVQQVSPLEQFTLFAVKGEDI